MIKWLFPVLLSLIVQRSIASDSSWIRINQLGYLPGGIKVAVWCSKNNTTVGSWQLVDKKTEKVVATGKTGKGLGEYGPFKQTYRLNFSSFKRSGQYYLRAGGITSPSFTISNEVYNGTADFCLRYMRQQRCGYNPFLKDSCHTQDGYSLYGKSAGIPDSTRFDGIGGWHDASDYLQYVTTSANATYHLLMAYRDFPNAFEDRKLATGLDGSNGIADVLDEAKWGTDWLLKMHPRADQMFNQIADDRDHRGMRIPKEDSFYGRGFERPVYFITGEPQQRGKFMNATTGSSSSAAKISSVFSLGSKLFSSIDPGYASLIRPRAATAMQYSNRKHGVTQTASVKSPYIYAEENWIDDMELQYAAAASTSEEHQQKFIDTAFSYAAREALTPWLGSDTASHYQWYPFINVGHRELAALISQPEFRQKDPAKYSTMRNQLLQWYRQGLEKVQVKANNAFLRGIPFIWCSNNLTAAFAIQAYWYRQLSGDKRFEELEQANIDWLFGCNPWGTSMVYGLPGNGDTPVDPHSAFTHLKKYPIDGGLVDGPVYGSIYNNLIGITLYEPDEYAAFQSKLAVYHDDYGDYSTNEPTMDGTASLVYLMAAKQQEGQGNNKKMTTLTNNSRTKSMSMYQGAIVRGDTSQKKIALVFTGDEVADGGSFINSTLKEKGIKASFFFTGRFYRNPAFKSLISGLKQQGHYLGAHSDQHLLYCDWTKRDSLLVTKKTFDQDLADNYAAMSKFGISKKQAPFFLPPYEWYNDSISSWTRQAGLQLINFSAGTRSNADYTWPELPNYQSSEAIYQSIIHYEHAKPEGLNGFLLLVHIGADVKRTDKFYRLLPRLITELTKRGYEFQTVRELLNSHPVKMPD